MRARLEAGTGEVSPLAEKDVLKAARREKIAHLTGIGDAQRLATFIYECQVSDWIKGILI